MLERLANALECSVDDLAPGIASASRMRGAALDNPPLEIRQVPGQSDVWVRMMRRVSLDQAQRILAILGERPESATAPAAPTQPTQPTVQPAPQLPAKPPIPPTPRFLIEADQQRRGLAAPIRKAPAPVKITRAPAKATPAPKKVVQAAKKPPTTRGKAKGGLG